MWPIYFRWPDLWSEWTVSILYGSIVYFKRICRLTTDIMIVLKWFQNQGKNYNLIQIQRQDFSSASRSLMNIHISYLRSTSRIKLNSVRTHFYLFILLFKMSWESSWLIFDGRFYLTHEDFEFPKKRLQNTLILLCIRFVKTIDMDEDQVH